MKLLSLPGELPFQLFGDTVTEDAPIILLSTCGGDFEEIKKLALNQEANEFCRGAALEAIAYGVVAQALEREDAIRFYEEALENRWTSTARSESAFDAREPAEKAGRKSPFPQGFLFGRLSSLIFAFCFCLLAFCF